MAEDKTKPGEGTGKESKPTAPPPTKDEIVAPPFKWVAKGEKGRGVGRLPQSSEESDNN